MPKWTLRAASTAIDRRWRRSCEVNSDEENNTQFFSLCFLRFRYTSYVARSGLCAIQDWKIYNGKTHNELNASPVVSSVREECGASEILSNRWFICMSLVNVSRWSERDFELCAVEVQRWSRRDMDETPKQKIHTTSECLIYNRAERVGISLQYRENAVRI